MDPSGRRSVNGATLALLVLAVLLSGFLLFRSSIFTVGAIVVEGNQYLAEEEVLRIAGVGARVNIFRLDIDDIRRRLTHDLRIASAEVYRHFPSSVVITVRERQPAAYIATSYGFAQLDGEGVVLAVAKSIHRMNIPLITGHHIGGSYVGEKVESPVVRASLTYLAALSEHSFNQISEVNIDSDGQLSAYSMQAIRIKLGAPERMAEKADKTDSILADNEKLLSTIEYIDLSYATPYVKFRSARGER